MKILSLVLALALVLTEVQTKGTFEAFKRKHVHNMAQGELKCTEHMKKANDGKPCRQLNSVIVIPEKSVLDDVINICRGEGVELPDENNLYRSTKSFTVIDCILSSPTATPPDECEYENGKELNNRIVVACEAKKQKDKPKPVHFEWHEPAASRLFLRKKLRYKA